jgi:hypothetical protein
MSLTESDSNQSVDWLAHDLFHIRELINDAIARVQQNRASAILLLMQAVSVGDLSIRQHRREKSADTSDDDMSPLYRGG